MDGHKRKAGNRNEKMKEKVFPDKYTLRQEYVRRQGAS